MPTTVPSPAPADSCRHERGPGITVCLRCRADTNRRASARQRSVAARAAMGIAGAVVLIVAGNGFVAARRQGQPARPGSDAVAAPESPARTFSVTEASASAPIGVAAPARPSIAVTAGRTEVPGGGWIQREGDSVVVHFDTPALRTRRRDKFEDAVRATLPLVYGSLAADALAAVPRGSLVGAGDLVRDLPSRGAELPAQRGWALTVWPGVRPGQDGPLVVSYRISLQRAR